MKSFNGVVLLSTVVLGQYKDVPAEPPKEPAPVKDAVEDPAYVPPVDPIDPPADYNDGQVDPAPVDPPKGGEYPPDVPNDTGYEDKVDDTDVYPEPDPSVDNGYEDEDDDVDEDEYDDVPPYDGEDPVYEDQYPQEPAPAEPYPAPDDSYPAPAPPAPVYQAPAQKECGALYVDVIQTWLTKVLSSIPPAVIQSIIDLLKTLLSHVKELDPSDPESVARLVEHVKTIALYCEENIPDIDEETKGYVVDAFTQMQQTYGGVYDTAVDENVYQAWSNLWTTCKTPSSPSPSPSPKTHAYITQFKSAYTGYLQDGPSSPTYLKDIEHLCNADDPSVKDKAIKAKQTIQTLSEEAEDATEAVQDSAGNVGFMRVEGVLGLLMMALF